MTEIFKDGNGVRRALSDLAKAAVKLASVASTEADWMIRFGASVVYAPRRIVNSRTVCNLRLGGRINALDATGETRMS